jgi:hypothetical protein
MRLHTKIRTEATSTTTRRWEHKAHSARTGPANTSRRNGAGSTDTRSTDTYLIALEEAPLQELQDELQSPPIILRLHLRYPFIEDEAHLAPSTRRFVGILAFANR